MNTTDLRDELAARTEDVRANAPALAASVANRVRAVRRRRTVVGAGAAAALAVVVGLVGWQGVTVGPAPVSPASRPTSSDSLGSDGMPYRTVPDAPGDVVKDGLRFRAQVGGDTLAVGLIGDVGQRTLSASWTPSTKHISYVAECWLPLDSTKEVLEGTLVRASIPGIKGYVESSCDVREPRAGDLPAGAYVPGEPGQGHPELKPGGDATLTVELVDPEGRPTSAPGARLAAAVYELGPQTEVRDTTGAVVWMVPDAREHQGYTYRLASVASGSVAGPVEIEAPRSGPFIVAYGTVGTGDVQSDPAFYGLEGLSTDTNLVQEGGLGAQPEASGHGQWLKLKLMEGSGPKNGTGVIAMYVPEGSVARPTG